MFGWLRRDKFAALRQSPDLVMAARAEAADKRLDCVSTEHLLLALCRKTDRPAWRAIAACGLSMTQIEAALSRWQEPGSGEVPPEEMPITPTARRTMERAAEYARQLGHPTVSSEHVLIALLGDPETVAYAALTELGIRPNELGLAVVREAGWPIPDTIPVT
jgi:ATP-dependent Clp protease ATP-binding subunit ClpC